MNHLPPRKHRKYLIFLHSRYARNGENAPNWNARKRAIISDRPFLLRGTLTLESQNLGSQNPAHLIDPSSSDALGQHHCLEEPALHKPRNLVAPYAPMPCHRAVEYHFSGSII